MHTMLATPEILAQTQVDPHFERRLPKRILACLSRSPRAPAIAAEAWRIAQTCQAQCQFIHVGSTEPQTQAYLRYALAEADVPHDIPLWLFEGRPRQVIDRVAREHEFDLVVVGVLNRQATLSQHVRSLAGQVAITSPCSVLLLTDPHVERRPLTRVVADVGFDDLSKAMLRSVLAWGQREKIKHWHVIHEYDPSGFYPSFDGHETRSQTELMRRLAKFLRSIDSTGVDIQTQCLPGRHGCDAIWYAQSMRAEVLCLPLSVRRQNFWERMLRFRLDVDIHALPCAVLLYRDQAGPDATYQEAS